MGNPARKQPSRDFPAELLKMEIMLMNSILYVLCEYAGFDLLREGMNMRRQEGPCLRIQGYLAHKKTTPP